MPIERFCLKCAKMTEYRESALGRLLCVSCGMSEHGAKAFARGEPIEQPEHTAPSPARSAGPVVSPLAIGPSDSVSEKVHKCDTQVRGRGRNMPSHFTDLGLPVRDHASLVNAIKEGRFRLYKFTSHRHPSIEEVVSQPGEARGGLPTMTLLVVATDQQDV